MFDQHEVMRHLLDQDHLTEVRRKMVEAFSEPDFWPEGPTWTTDQLRGAFEILAFAAPFVVAVEKKTGQRGTLCFKHSPRVYFSWRPDEAEVGGDHAA